MCKITHIYLPWSICWVAFTSLSQIGTVSDVLRLSFTESLTFFLDVDRSRLENGVCKLLRYLLNRQNFETDSRVCEIILSPTFEDDICLDLSRSSFSAYVVVAQFPWFSTRKLLNCFLLALSLPDEDLRCDEKLDVHWSWFWSNWPFLNYSFYRQ